MHILKEIDIIAFLNNVMDYNDQRLNFLGIELCKNGGKIFVLQNQGQNLSFALLNIGMETHIIYLFTPPELRRQSYAQLMIQELQRQYDSLECSFDLVKDFPFKSAIMALVQKTGFRFQACFAKFVIECDDISAWTETPLWQGYVKYVERFRQKGWRVVNFARATAEQLEYVNDSYHNAFQSSLDPKIIVDKKIIVPDLSFFLVKDALPVAYTFMIHPDEKSYDLKLASTAQKYLGKGYIFILYFEVMHSLSQPDYRGKKLKYIISVENVASLRLMEHFLTRLKMKKSKMNVYSWKK